MERYVTDGGGGELMQPSALSFEELGTNPQSDQCRDSPLDFMIGVIFMFLGKNHFVHLPCFVPTLSLNL